MFFGNVKIKQFSTLVNSI